MQSPEEFIKCYLREHAELLRAHLHQSTPFHEKYYDEAFLKRYREFHTFESANPESLVSVENSGDTATAITSKILWGTEQGSRYHLTLSEERWRIMKVERRCHYCQGSGNLFGKVCDGCNGTGWWSGGADNQA
jgi:hypothetical protein